MATVTAKLPVLPFFLQASDEDPDLFYTAADFRLHNQALLPRSGALTATSFVVRESSPIGWEIVVNGGSYNLNGYLIRMTDDMPVSLLSFNTNPSAQRTHKVWLAVYDSLVTEADIDNDAASDYTARIVVTEDTGSGAPVPAGATEYGAIADVVITTGQSFVRQANLTDARTHASPGSPPLSIALAPGITDASGALFTHPVRARYMNGQVTLAGTLSRTGGFSVGDVHSLGTLNRNLWPSRKKFLLGAAGSQTTATAAWRLTISTVGTMFAHLPAGGTSPGWLFLDGITYDLD